MKHLLISFASAVTILSISLQVAIALPIPTSSATYEAPLSNPSLRRRAVVGIEPQFQLLAQIRSNLFTHLRSELSTASPEEAVKLIEDARKFYYGTTMGALTPAKIPAHDRVGEAEARAGVKGKPGAESLVTTRHHRTSATFFEREVKSIWDSVKGKNKELGDYPAVDTSRENVDRMMKEVGVVELDGPLHTVAVFKKFRML